VNFEDWIFALHLLTAATLVGSLVMSWIVVVALWSADTPAATLGLNRVATVGNGLSVVGLAGVIVFGIWLAILRDAVQLWDGWVLAALVLWLIATLALSRSFVEYGRPVARARALAASGESGSSGELGALNRSRRGLALRLVGSLAVVVIVVDMIWKPGA
jgi:predicted integral membrane protein DUF2269